jgi:Tfp pilus assembly protein PilX
MTVVTTANLGRAKRRLRSAEALLRDSEQAVRDERTLAVYRNAERERAVQARYQRVLAELGRG